MTCYHSSKFKILNFLWLSFNYRLKGVFLIMLNFYTLTQSSGQREEVPLTWSVFLLKNQDHMSSCPFYRKGFCLP